MNHSIRTLSVAIVFCMTALSSAASMATNTQPTITRNNQYIFIETPTPLDLFDKGQQHALSKITQLISKNVTNMNVGQSLDPNGDLTALQNSLNAMTKKLDLLQTLAIQAYGDISSNDTPVGKWLKTAGVPSGVVLFGSAEFDKSFYGFPVLNRVTPETGGSLTVGFVITFYHVTRIEIKTGKVLPPFLDWKTSVIFVPNLNAGIDVNAVGTNSRYGVGIVFGQLNQPSDLYGPTVGTSGTVDFPAIARYLGLHGDGLNVKVMGVLPHTTNTTFFQNMVVLIGMDKGAPTTKKNAILPIIHLDAELHGNVSYIFSRNLSFTPSNSQIRNLQALEGVQNNDKDTSKN